MAYEKLFTFRVVYASNLMSRVQKDDFETLKKLPKLTHGHVSTVPLSL